MILIRDLQQFTSFDPKKPRGMDKSYYEFLLALKRLNKEGTTPDSLDKRFNLIKKQWDANYKTIDKDIMKRFDTNTKERMYFDQECKCAICRKPLLYEESEADHIKKHADGGKTLLKNGQLLHHACHVKKHKNEK